jgi:hypothetical protein
MLRLVERLNYLGTGFGVTRLYKRVRALLDVFHEVGPRGVHWDVLRNAFPRRFFKGGVDRT